MKPDLKPGANDEQTITTTKEMGIVHLGPDAPSMYSTPAMVSLAEINGRRFKFDVEVVNEDGVKIGEGIHERALIDISRFAASAKS
jgi:predicted thioesterase